MVTSPIRSIRSQLQPRSRAECGNGAAPRGNGALRHPRRAWVLLAAVSAVWLAMTWRAAAEGPGPAPDQPAAAAASAPATESGEAGPKEWSFLEIVLSSGWTGACIILLSIAAVALVIELLVTLRKPVLMPPNLGEEVHGLLAAGKVAAADARCNMEPSMFSYVLRSGLAEAEGGWPVVEKAVEDALAEQSARLMRRVDYLAVIGNIAPMLGLLGTVLGMVTAFKRVAETQGAARAADLAEGIYLALVTTIEGLLVAIPSLAAFAAFRNRVDELMAEAAAMAQHVFAPLRRARGPARIKSPPPPPPPSAAGGT